MADRTNRRDEIVDAATTLFFNQGYNATSVRQIAEQVGCTEAALYYHFKDKRALLQAVVECNLPDLAQAVADLTHAESLSDLITQFVHKLYAHAGTHLSEKIRWLTREFPAFSDDERELIYAKHRELRHVLEGALRRFVDDETQAHNLAWMLLLMVFGYGQLILTMDMQKAIPLDLEAFAEEVRARLATRG